MKYVIELHSKNNYQTFQSKPFTEITNLQAYSKITSTKSNDVYKIFMCCFHWVFFIHFSPAVPRRAPVLIRTWNVSSSSPSLWLMDTSPWWWTQKHRDSKTHTESWRGDNIKVFLIAHLNLKTNKNVCVCVCLCQIPSWSSLHQLLWWALEDGENRRAASWLRWALRYLLLARVGLIIGR